MAWVQRRRAAGIDPTVYCNQENSLHLVQAAFQAAGIPEPHYWTAAYPGIGKALYANTISHQYANPLTSGGHFDLSVVAPYWPGVDASSTPTQEDKIMTPEEHEWTRQNYAAIFLGGDSMEDGGRSISASLGNIATSTETPAPVNVQVDVPSLAAAIAALIPTDLAQQVANELSKRLAS